MRYLLAAAILCSACSGSPSAPSPQPPVITTTTITISGSVHATNGGQPLSGLQAALGNVQAVTDAAGGFAIQMPPAGTLALALSGSGIVPRSLFVAAGSSRAVSVDAIALAGFDLNFYRQMVRNGLDTQGSALQPLRRWTRDVHVFLQTDADVRTLDMVEQTLRDAIPRWTAGRFNVVEVERGSGTPQKPTGWLLVLWRDEPNICGSTAVGGDGGVMFLSPPKAICTCAGFALKPQTVRHEAGHAMGFWHTDSPADAMYGQANSVCDAPISARELAAAAVAYSRPVGNVDPDQDPAGVVTLAPMRIH